MPDRQRLFAELDAHDRMGNDLDAERGAIFVSDWNGAHPFTEDFLGSLAKRPITDFSEVTSYSHLDEDEHLAERLADLHVGVYGESGVNPRSVVVGAGATAFLYTLIMYQHLRGVRQVLYVPPVYYNAAWWIKALGWSVTRVLDDVDMAVPEGALLRLPNERSLLWLTDPVWFAGVRVRQEAVDQIAEWQARTGSTVVIDGTFQYMRPSSDRAERTSALDPSLTFRLVCPTKALGMHGFRFAYTLVPPRERDTFVELHGRAHGAGGVADRLFAHRAVDVLADPLLGQALSRYGQELYRGLSERGAFAEHVMPEGGYFVFARPACPARPLVGMSAACFGSSSYADFLRVNVLLPGIRDALIRGDATAHGGGPTTCRPRSNDRRSP